MKRSLNVEAPIGWGIRILREKYGISVTELAEKIEISKSHLSQIERGAISNPTWAIIERSAEVLNCQPGKIKEGSLEVFSTVSDKIKELRQERGLTRKDLAEKADLEERVITSIEEKNKITYDALTSIASVFDLNVKDLKRKKGEENNEGADQPGHGAKTFKKVGNEKHDHSRLLQQIEHVINDENIDREQLEVFNETIECLIKIVQRNPSNIQTDELNTVVQNAIKLTLDRRI